MENLTSTPQTVSCGSASTSWLLESYTSGKIKILI